MVKNIGASTTNSHEFSTSDVKFSENPANAITREWGDVGFWNWYHRCSYSLFSTSTGSAQLDYSFLVFSPYNRLAPNVRGVVIAMRLKVLMMSFVCPLLGLQLNSGSSALVFVSRFPWLLGFKNSSFVKEFLSLLVEWQHWAACSVTSHFLIDSAVLGTSVPSTTP